MSGIDRRHFLRGMAAAGFVLPPACRWPGGETQAPVRLPIIGTLSPTLPEERNLATEGLLQGLREHGLVDGQTVVIERKTGDGTTDRLPELAAQLVSRQVNIIVVSGNEAAFAAKNATSTIPIVMLQSADPVGVGLVPSLARPGGNVTGMSVNAGRGLNGKRLQLLHAFVPTAARVAALFYAGEPSMQPPLKETQEAAQALEISILPIAVTSIDDLEWAFEAMVRERAQAITLVGGPFFYAHRARLAQLALQHKLPSIQARPEYAYAGGLMAHGPSFFEMARRGAGHVAKILKGTKPADIPVEQPTKFDCVLNLKTARELGLTIPRFIELQVTEVVE